MTKKVNPTANKAAYKNVIESTPFRFVLSTSKKHFWWAFSTILFVTLAQSLGASMSLLISLVVDAVVAAPTEEAQLAALQYWGIVFVLFSVVLYTSWRIAGFSAAVYIIRQNRTALEHLFAYIPSHSHSYFSNRFAGSISNKISNAGDGGSRLLERFLFGVYQQSILIIVLGVFLLKVHYSLVLIYAFTVLSVVYLNVFLVRWRRPHVIAFSRASSTLRGEGVDLLTNIQATRQYARTKFEEKRINDRIFDRTYKDKKQWFIGEYINIINNLIAVLLTAVVIYVTYRLLASGMASAGELVLAMLVMFRVAGSLVHIGEVMNGFIRIYGEVEEGLEDLSKPHEIVDGPDTKQLLVEEARVVWKDVSFEFDDNQVFNDFNLSIPAGQRVGLVGHSGAGKTTFVSLLLRQHDIHSGVIEIDGQNIAGVTQDSLRQHIAVVPQEPLLFHRTIKENIAYGKPNATQKEIETVAKKAQAHDFITQLSEGYDTLVGERGVKLSGGQKQRVAIARAMLKEAPILLLDEATSALDSESEVEIQKALHRLMSGKTVVAVAHRLSTLREMDRIIVLENGKIVEDGSHEALVKYGGVYAKLWEHQAGGFLQT